MFNTSLNPTWISVKTELEGSTATSGRAQQDGRWRFWPPGLQPLENLPRLGH